ncbi:hypothetical protein J7E95_21935 [Streptomyces sp. ISL-14]|nr:hypothetical protein [Streptomyces sp. ISL-14]
MADSRRKGSGFLKSNGTFFNKKPQANSLFFEFVYSLGLLLKEVRFLYNTSNKPAQKNGLFLWISP